MAVAVSTGHLVSVDGKFFRLGENKFFVKGLTYGPFAPNAAGEPYASPEQTERDFALIAGAGANVIRVYHTPGRWFLDLAQAHGLKVFLDIPWNKHLCFLEDSRNRAEAIDQVRRAVYACAGHPSVFAYSVANEIPADVVRWTGANRVSGFIELLVEEAKRIHPDCLCTYANFPPTEFLRPANVDFLCFNVYLHQPAALRAYLSRLQMIADAKPLVLGEFGMDSLREGPKAQAQFLEDQVENAFRSGLAGAIAFSFTDDWWRGGQQVEGWELGVTTRDRTPKPAFYSLQHAFSQAPYFPLPRTPRVSVVVASYNGDRILNACLDSLEKLNYPDYEIILVDDGSTDTTPQIAARHPNVRCFRHEKNLGLSVARNTGIAAATGEIIAFTDSDCRADPDWLFFLVGDLLKSGFAAIGGPNLLPPEDSPVAAAVMVSPGGPAHVMLTDRQAEHIPGCNMAFYKWALEEIGGFDPIFTAAGDDVDVCWRLQQAGYKIGFSPGGFVWHYRRSTIRDYLKQQRGYGQAEALLVRKHPEYFNALGGSIWRGRIYTSAKLGLQLRQPIIYRGLFGSAGFSSVYAVEPANSLMFVSTLEYHVAVTLTLWVLSVSFHHVMPLAITSLLVSLGFCAAAGWQAALPFNKHRWWSRPLVGLLFFLQPIVRGWARYQGRLAMRQAGMRQQESLNSALLKYSEQSLREIQYWSEQRINRLSLVADVLRRLHQQGWPYKPDSGWSEYDVEIQGGRWSNLQITTVAEEHAGGKQLIRCRLQPRWSLPAKALFWVLCGLQFLVLGLTAPKVRWVCLSLLLLPVFFWFLQREHRKLQSLARAFLDSVAADWKLVKMVESTETEPKPEPRSPVFAAPESERSESKEP